MEIDNSRLKENHELRAMARERLKGNWGNPILVCFLYSIILGGVGAIPAVGPIVSVVVSGPFLLGLAIYFIRFTRMDNPPIEVMFDGFKNFGSSFLLSLLVGIFTFLWALLLIIPGIIASLSYSQAFYILSDNPQIGVMDAIRQSKEMMKGRKWKYFVLQLSFIGWGLLSVLSLGIGFLWLIPYIQTTEANFYNDLKFSSLTPIEPIQNEI